MSAYREYELSAVTSHAPPPYITAATRTRLPDSIATDRRSRTHSDNEHDAHSDASSRFDRSAATPAAPINQRPIMSAHSRPRGIP